MSSITSKQFIGAVEDEWQLYSNNFADYTLGTPIGFGASSIVYSAIYQPPSSMPDGPKPTPIPCALKVLDLDSLPLHALRLLERETTLMSLSKHPNVLRVRGSWMDGHKLYIALRLMNKGSAADVMRYAWPGGMEEEVIRCILKQALKGINYLHINGFIHRDVKAANLLIDDDGTVLLGDLGVAANLADDTDSPKRVINFDAALKPIRPKMGKRQSFVGTPCWMAPEVIQGRQYDSAADIWSFGITALELAQGRPPRSREPAERVLLKIVQDAPPTLEHESNQHKYSRAFKEVVQSCLNKDPTERPTATQLLATPFFKGAKKKSFLVGSGGILNDLPPLTQRQERRPRANFGSGTSARTIDSWDFVTTLRSALPTADGRGRTGSHGHARGSSGSGSSPRTSPNTSIGHYIHGRGLSTPGQNLSSSLARLERVSNGETERKSMPGDDRTKPSKEAVIGSFGDAEKVSNSSESYTLPSSTLDPLPSVCGPVQTAERRFPIVDKETLKRPSTSAAISSLARPGKGASPPELSSTPPSFWRRLAHGAVPKDKVGVDDSTERHLVHKASLKRISFGRKGD